MEELTHLPTLTMAMLMCAEMRTNIVFGCMGMSVCECAGAHTAQACVPWHT